MDEEQHKIGGTFNKDKANQYYNSILENIKNRSSEEQQQLLNQIFPEEKIYATSIQNIKKNIIHFLGGATAAEIEEDIKKHKTEKKVAAYGLLIDNYNLNVEKFYDAKPFFYDKSGSFWLWKDYKYEMTDETDMMNLIDDELGFMGQTVNSTLKNNYLEAFRRVGRKHIPKDAPSKWIQFKDKAYSLKSSKIYTVTPDYFFTNPIMWELGKTDETPVMDRLITEWVGEKYKDTAYEIIAYCCYSDYPIHLIFSLIGCGSNGKSKFLGLINKFIGKENICSTELDVLLDSRFESAKLYKKLVCTMGETNFGVISKTSLLKKLTGQDMIGYEFKNKKPFDDYNYAKIIISSNSLPPSTDTSEGFYRRWLILDFSNSFPEGHDILKTIDDFEYNNLSLKVLKILKKLLENGKFTNQGSISERQEKYVMASNPLGFFIKQYCKKDVYSFMRYSELYIAYVQYLQKIKRRKIGYKEFNDVLASEGFEVVKTSKMIGESWVNGRFIEGISLVTDVTVVLKNPLSKFTIGKEVENRAQPSQASQESPQEEQVSDTLYSFQYTTQDYLTFIREKGAVGYPKPDFEAKYTPEVVDTLLSKGEIIESPMGILRVAE